MSQDSIIIYRDIRDTLLTLPPELCKEVMRLLFAYAFDDQEPDEDADPIAKGFFLAFKSRFDMNAARLERNQANGRKGGAPKGNQNARKKTTENGKETTQNNPKQPKTTEAEGITTEEVSTVEENNPKQPKTTEAEGITTEEVSTVEENNPKQSISISISKSILTSTNVEDKEKIEKEKTTEKKKKEKIAFASSVQLTQEEYNAFVEQYGEDTTRELIQILNDYKEANGKRYKSDAAAIRSWVVDRYLQKQKPSSYGQPTISRPQTGTRPVSTTVENAPEQTPRRFKGTL